MHFNLDQCEISLYYGIFPGEGSVFKFTFWEESAKRPLRPGAAKRPSHEKPTRRAGNFFLKCNNTRWPFPREEPPHEKGWEKPPGRGISVF